MAKILLISSGLKHAQDFVEPFLKRLEVYLNSKADCDCIDVRRAETFDERTFFEYDQVVFLFSTAMNSIPSSTLEIFQKLELQSKNHTEIYALIACDEYEAEKCNLSERIIQKWCQREDLKFQGSLKIGSAFFIMKSASKFVVSNYIYKGFFVQFSMNKKHLGFYCSTSALEHFKEIQRKNEEVRKKLSLL